MALAGMNVHPTRAIVILKNRKRCIFFTDDVWPNNILKPVGRAFMPAFGLRVGLAGMNARPTRLNFIK